MQSYNVDHTEANRRSIQASQFANCWRTGGVQHRRHRPDGLLTTADYKKLLHIFTELTDRRFDRKKFPQ